MCSRKTDAAIVSCLEYVATSTSPPGAGARDFLLRLFDVDEYTLDEIDQIATAVAVIIRAIQRDGYVLAARPPAADDILSGRETVSARHSTVQFPVD